MKKRTRTAAFLVMVFCVLLSSSAYAANETETKTTVTYELQEEESKGGGVTYTPDATGDGGTDEQKIYELDIPATVSLNEGNALNIRMSYCELPEGKNIIVYIDGDRTFDSSDGYLHLKAAGEHDDAKVMVSRNTADFNNLEEVRGPGLHEVGVYDWSWIFPSKYGYLSLDLIYIDQIEPDTYTGTIYFAIKVVDV